MQLISTTRRDTTSMTAHTIAISLAKRSVLGLVKSVKTCNSCWRLSYSANVIHRIVQATPQEIGWRTISFLNYESAAEVPLEAFEVKANVGVHISQSGQQFIGPSWHRQAQDGTQIYAQGEVVMTPILVF